MRISYNLQLTEKTEPFNFIWVAVSSKGTVVKIDTQTGEVLGEYYTSPAGQPGNPSRTTVDHNGNVWLGNRDGNSVVCIGLYENGGWIDKNGDGICQTSTGQGELLGWTNSGGADTGGGVSTAEDECILYYVRTSSSGTRHLSVNKDNDFWVSGTIHQTFDLIDGNTGQIIRSEPSVGYGGYGSLIDSSGVIWSARRLLRWDTALPLAGPDGGNWRGYGHDSYGLGIDSQGNVWNVQHPGNIIHKFNPSGDLTGSYNHGNYYAQGVVVDKNDHVWVAHSLYESTVGHLLNDGTFIGNISVGSGPTGVAVDGDGKIWATLYNDGKVVRIDPTLEPIGADGVTPVGAVDFVSPYLGGNLYNYSDMTGSTLHGVPGNGTWSVVFDSEIPGAQWNKINWNGLRVNDGTMRVNVSVSEEGLSYDTPVRVSNNSHLSALLGRFIKIEVNFLRASTGDSPVLYDLTIGTKGYSMVELLNTPPMVEAGEDFSILENEVAELSSLVQDDCLLPQSELSFAWSLTDGPREVVFTDNGEGTGSIFPEPGYTDAGTYPVIVSEPVTLAVLKERPEPPMTDFDLRTWEHIVYEWPYGDPVADWVVNSDGSMVTQITNN